ncbi:uncharacterized protein RB166_015018 [Leptodactylus fuscus]
MDTEELYSGMGAVLWFGTNVALAVIGIIHRDDCSYQPYVPIFMIVSGLTQALMCLFIPVKIFYRKVFIAVESILFTFSVCWLIAGCVWVFGVRPVPCNPLVYYFTLVIVIFEIVMCCLFVIVVIVVLYKTFAESRKEPESEIPSL